MAELDAVGAFPSGVVTTSAQPLAPLRPSAATATPPPVGITHTTILTPVNPKPLTSAGQDEENPDKPPEGSDS